MRIKAFLYIFAIFFVLGTTFQNCSRSSQTVSNSAEPELTKKLGSQAQSVSGGGDGSFYDGKLHYYAVNPSVCKSVGKNDQIVASEIVKSNGTFQLVSNDCKTREATTVNPSDFRLKSMNNQFFVYEGRIYEYREEYPKVTVEATDRVIAYCQGSYEDPKSGLKTTVDGLVRDSRMIENASFKREFNYVIEAFVYGPRPVLEAFDASKIVHYKFGARDDLRHSEKVLVAWQRMSRVSFMPDTTNELQEFLSLAILKPDFYKSGTQGELLTGYMLVPMEGTQSFFAYSKCVNNL